VAQPSASSTSPPTVCPGKPDAAEGTERVYFAFVIDAYSRMIVGWQLAVHMRADLVLDALKMALGLRGPGADVELVHHSDRGSQYTSGEYSQTLDDHGVLASVGSVGDAYDCARGVVRRQLQDRTDRRPRLAVAITARAGGRRVRRLVQQWWDGSGYPRGLAGEEIPLTGRLVAVAELEVCSPARLLTSCIRMISRRRAPSSRRDSDGRSTHRRTSEARSHSHDPRDPKRVPGRLAFASTACLHQGAINEATHGFESWNQGSGVRTLAQTIALV
jgi:Integrase core domain/HD domain